MTNYNPDDPVNPVDPDNLSEAERFEIAERIKLAHQNFDNSEPDIEILRDVQLFALNPKNDRVVFWMRDYHLNNHGQRLVEIDEAKLVAEELATFFGDPDIAEMTTILKGFNEFQIGTLRDAKIIRDLLTKLIDSNGRTYSAELYSDSGMDTDSDPA